MDLGSRLRITLTVALVVLSGCAGTGSPGAAPTEDLTSGTPTSESEPGQTTTVPVSNWTGEATLTNVSVGSDVENRPEWTNASHQPRVDADGSTISVVGRIVGISDPACINVTGVTTTNSVGRLTLTIRSRTDYPAERGCNQSAWYWAYDARIVVDGQLPDTIRVEHVDGHHPGRNWTIPVTQTGADTASRPSI